MLANFLNLVRLALLIAGSLTAFSAKATPSDELRLHYYFLRSSLAGQPPFAKALHEFRIKFEKARESKGGVEPYDHMQSAMEIMERVPKSLGESESVVADVKTLLSGGSETAGKIIGKANLYSTASKYLMSGSMKASRAYEIMGMNSELELEQFRDDVIFFVSEANAGSLTFVEREPLDLLFKYYTGVPTGLTNEQILDDPLMLPVKEASRLEKSLKETVSKSLIAFTRETRVTLDLIKRLAADQQLREIFAKELDAIKSSEKFEEIDKALSRVIAIPCVGDKTAACADTKRKVIDAAQARIVAIELAELQFAVDQGIQLGLAVGQLTRNEDLSKAFKTLDVLNGAVKGINLAMKAYNAANTSFATFGAVAMASTAVIGAVGAIAVIAMDDGGSTDKAILQSLQELKEMIAELSQQVAAGFKDLAVRNDRIESLIHAYSKLTSKNLATIQKEVAGLSHDIGNGLQPLGLVEITYRQEAFRQLARLKKSAHELAFLLPPPNVALTNANRETVLNLFVDLATIVDAVKAGEYRIAVKGEDAVAAHLRLIEWLAAYPPTRFRSAFLVQNAINASSSAACATVNVIGYQMISDAAAQLNAVVDKVSHFQLAGFFSDAALNKAEFVSAMRGGQKFVDDQRAAVTKCLGSEFFNEFDVKQLQRTLDFVDAQTDEFLGDGARLNQMLLTLQKQLNPPTRFRADNFIVGELVQASRSFEPANWSKIAPPAFVLPGYELGSANTGFRFTRNDFERLVSSPDVRLAHTVGIDIEYKLETWWHGFPTPASPFTLSVYSPLSRKVMNVWWGRIAREQAGPENFVTIPRRTASGTLSTDYPNGKFGEGKLSAIYTNVSKYAGLFGSINVPYGRASYSGQITDQQIKDWEIKYCRSVGGFYDCRETGWQPVSGYQSHFDAEIFFNEPPYTLKNNLSTQSAMRLFYYRNSINNAFRIEFEPATVAYVNHLRGLSAALLGTCLEVVVQGGVKCDADGMEVLFPDQRRKLRQIENLTLIRSTIDPVSSRVQELLKLTDVSQIPAMVVEESADTAISRIRAYRQTIIDRIEKLKNSTEGSATELSPEILEVMETDYDWLNRRIRPFASVPAN
jgi:hypothetical protein